MDYNCYVYWIHRPCDLDIMTQGYIGISNKPATRWKQHLKRSKTSKSNHRLYNSLRLHSDYVFDILVLSTRSYCFEVEEKLRPQKNIGLNSQRGGLYTPSNKEICSSLREKLTLAAKEAYINDPTLKERCGRMNAGRVLTDEHKKKISESGKGLQKAWNNSIANKAIWLLADEMYLSFITGECTTYYSLSKKFNLKVYQTKNVFQLFKSGWNPLNDIDYQRYKKKEIKCH